MQITYNFLLAAHQKYGSDERKICKASLKCEPEQIQENVIIAPTWEADVFSSHVDSISNVAPKTCRGTINELCLNDKKVTFITTGIGACNVLDATLTLGCTPCKNVIFMGSVGALDKNMKIGDIVIPEYCICGVGANRYLTSNPFTNNDTFGEKFYPNEDLSNQVLSIARDTVKNTDVNVHIGKTFSVDTVFAEYVHLDEILNTGCNSIEMETSTFFHAASIANLKAAAIFSVSDNTFANKSLYSGRTEHDKLKKDKVNSEIVPNIVLKALNTI